MRPGRPSVAQDIVRAYMGKKADRVLDLRLDEPQIQKLAVERLGRQIDIYNAVDRLKRVGQLHSLQAGRLAYTEQPAPTARLMDLDPVADAVLRRLDAPYYVSWHSALWHHGLIDQQSRRVYVAIQRRKRSVSIGLQTVQFVTISDSKKFFGGEAAEGYEWPVVIARAEKALVDSLDKPRYAAPLPVIANALRRAYVDGLIKPERLVADAVLFGSPHLNRRLGFFMDLMGIPGSEELELRLGRGWAIPLEPSRTYDAEDDRPPVDPKWRVFADPGVIGTALELK